MKPITIVLLVVVGLGAWLLITDYPAVISTLTSLEQADQSDQADTVLAETVDEDVSLSDLDNDAEEPSLVVDDTVSNVKSEEDVGPAVSEGAQGTSSTQEESAQQAAVGESVPVPDEEKISSEIMETDDAITETDDAPATQEHAAEKDSVVSPFMTPPEMTQRIHPYPYNVWTQPSMQNYTGQNYMGQNYAGYSWMATMFNPFYWMRMNPIVDAMTRPQSMDAMMRSMDPRMMFGTPGLNYDNSEVPDKLPIASLPGFPTQTRQVWPKNTVSEGISREAKMNAFQTAMAMNPLSMRNMVSMMTDKIPVAEGVTWDDAVEAMKLRANEVNFKFVGSSPLWKEIEAVTGQPSARVEIFRFCDGAVARKILDEVPEFIVFLPCRISLTEDADGKLWVMTLDWDVSWMDFAQNPNNHLAKDLRADAKYIRESIQYIMEGAATGEF